MAGRALNQKTPATPPIKPPASLDEWNRLMRQAIEAAERLGDRRVGGLRRPWWMGSRRDTCG